jgi:hypothetical protein
MHRASANPDQADRFEVLKRRSYSADDRRPDGAGFVTCRIPGAGRGERAAGLLAAPAASGGSLRLLASAAADRRLRVAVLAPPWIAVPPPGDGGIEAVVDLLFEALVDRGHEVALFAAPGSRSPARVRTLLAAAHTNTIGSALYECDHAPAWRRSSRRRSR